MFKVGDRVRHVRVNYTGNGVIRDIREDGVHVVEFPTWYGMCEERESALELVNDGPIRIVTRREIVPGRYGVVEIGEQAKGLAPIRISNRNGELRNTTAEELREAAHVLNQIAEALADEED